MKFEVLRDEMRKDTFLTDLRIDMSIASHSIGAGVPALELRRRDSWNTGRPVSFRTTGFVSRHVITNV